MILHRFHRALALLALSLPVVAVAAAPAPSLTVAFVASYGDDASAGNATNPKRHFQAAHNAVADHGQIIVLDTGGFGPLRITKSLTITVPPGVIGLITTAGNTAITIDAPAGDVTLRGLTLSGTYHTGASADAGNGVTVNAVETLRVENCTLRNFYRGIVFQPSTAASLLVRDTRVQNVNDGIDIFATASNVSVQTTVSGCTIDKANGIGVYAYRDANAVNASARMTLSRCVFTNNGYGAYASSGGTFHADACNFSNNGIGVIVAAGSSSTSAGNNSFSDNGTNGDFTTLVGTK